MKRIQRIVALAAASAAVLACAGPASAAEQTQTFKYPVTVGGYQVKQAITLADHPNVDGFITGMSVNVVDAQGKAVPIRRIMLHHVVFTKIGAQNPQCPQFTGFDASQKFPGVTTPFYGAGEERNVLRLPPGYGLETKAADKWLMVWMLMNHRKTTDHAFIQWKVTYDTSTDLKPVHPYWLDVKNCNADPIFSVPGGRGKGSTYVKRYRFDMPESGRIVAAGGHVHGGAKDLAISRPACVGEGPILTMRPAWGLASHPFYHVRPILHEPGPIGVSGYLTAQGIPLAQGQPLQLTARYDDSYPHTRVMGISMVYVAPSSTPVDGCGPLPADLHQYLRPKHYRSAPPRFIVPIVGIDPRTGRAHDISRPPGGTVKLNSGSTIDVRNYYFSQPNVAVKRGAKLNWAINSQLGELHNVTLASGPRGFASPNHSNGRFSYRFGVRGKYRIFCALHPVSMTEVVDVR